MEDLTVSAPYSMVMHCTGEKIGLEKCGNRLMKSPGWKRLPERRIAEEEI